MNLNRTTPRRCSPSPRRDGRPLNLKLVSRATRVAIEEHHDTILANSIRRRKPLQLARPISSAKSRSR